MSAPRPILPADIADGMLIARYRHGTFLPATNVRHYVYGTSCWHETGRGDRGGFGFTYPAGEHVYVIEP